MRQSETITAIAPAIVKASAELGPIAKDATNPAFRNKYATLDAIMEQVRPVLAKHGLAVMQGVTHPETVDGRVVGLAVETRLLHLSGEWIASTVTLPVEKATAQGAGSAISYGRRYGLSAMLGLTAEDDDGNAASAPRSTPGRSVNHVHGTTTVARVEVQEPEGRRMYETVPDTPRRKPYTGNVTEALETPFPFKKRPELHGKPLGQIPLDVLSATAEWCRKTDAAKFGDLLDRIHAVQKYFEELEQDQLAEDQRRADDLDALPF